MKTVKPTDLEADDLEEGIANALKAGDIPAVGVLLKALAFVDADRAQTVLETLKLGAELAHVKASSEQE